ncbi:hypothetical protein [Floridanema evergladense]|uniref:Uncharacterized protein n=1 Tax=Floridaenema evergladense BLCC-F167 TaxID=3153639 RepID=A0ABV4WRW6_9CYAN
MSNNAIAINQALIVGKVKKATLIRQTSLARRCNKSKEIIKGIS